MSVSLFALCLCLFILIILLSSFTVAAIYSLAWGSLFPLEYMSSFYHPIIVLIVFLPSLWFTWPYLLSYLNVPAIGHFIITFEYNFWFDREGPWVLLTQRGLTLIFLGSLVLVRIMASWSVLSVFCYIVMSSFVLYIWSLLGSIALACGATWHFAPSCWGLTVFLVQFNCCWCVLVTFGTLVYAFCFVLYVLVNSLYHFQILWFASFLWWILWISL